MPFPVRIRTPICVFAAMLAACGSDDPTDPGDSGEPETLTSTESCADFSGADIVTFEDINLEEVVRSAAGLAAGADLTCDVAAGITTVTSENNGIASLAGIQNLVALEDLDLTENPISDLTPLADLTSLEDLDVAEASVTDVSALAGLTALTSLDLAFNDITDVTALGGLTAIAYLSLNGSAGLDDIEALIASTGYGTGTGPTSPAGIRAVSSTRAARPPPSAAS